MSALDDHLFDRDGQPISWERYVELKSHPTYKRVGSTHVGEGLWVSTVWLGHDHGFGFTDRPIIFETMVFVTDDDGGSTGTEQERYATESEALAGHEQMVASLRATLNVFETEPEPGS